MLSVGQLIWISCRPLFRLIICTGCGFFLTKADLFPAVAAQGTSQILLNITYPCLLFSKIVPSFSVQNIAALAPIVLIAVLYQILGGVVAWIVTQLFWVPHRFRWGILVAGVWGNVGDIPTAVVLSIMGAAPFNGSADQALSIGYISGFIFVGVITFFPVGGNRLVAMDYVGPDIEHEDVKEALQARHRRIFVQWPRRLIRKLNGGKSVFPDDLTESDDRPAVNELEKTPSDGRSDRISGGPSHGTDERLPTSSTTRLTPTSRGRRLRSAVFTFLRNLLIPASVSIIASFAIALAPPLKALFIPVDGTHIHPAPDGQPLLAFVMDAASFIGAASVPMGLVCLGSALARLRVPRGSWDRLPVGAILAFSVGKLLVFPGLVHAGVIASEDKVLQFICMFFACLPTATTQVFVTQVASGTGSAEHLSAFLIPQYALMLISMTALTAYALQTLF
ncbi:auxin efflux carrier transmembrane protein [Mycena leptocephala]|nr:auxin efflux carrier transmembrane protein [Mycena leptocephala]